MKTLYFNRHAKSDWSDGNLSDFDRPLNKRGLKDSPVMGNRLKERGDHIEVFITSPARRALSTARIMAEHYGYPANRIKEVDSLYLPSVRDFLDVISHINESYDSAIIFAHNPGITEVVEYLTGASIGNMPTCGIAKLSFPMADTWEEISRGSGNLDFFDYPKKEFP